MPPKATGSQKGQLPFAKQGNQPTKKQGQAPAKKGNAQPGASKKKSAIGGESTKANCIRCYPEMPVPGGETPQQHKLSKCFFAPPDSLHKLWSTYSTIGSDADDILDRESSKQLIETVSQHRPGTFRGLAVTKTLLEAAWQVDRHPNSDAGRKAGARIDAAAEQRAAAAALASREAALQRVAEAESSAQHNTPLTSTSFDAEPVQETQRISPPAYRFAVHDTDLDSSLIPSGAVADLKVATNYVAVKRLPLTLHMYSLTFGNTEPVLTEAEVAEKMSKLSVPGSAEPSQDGAGPKQVAQRSEMVRVLKALSERGDFREIIWATDYSLFWSQEQLPSSGGSDPLSPTFRNIHYQKLSGRKFKVDKVDFRYLRSIDLGRDHSAATKALVSAEPGRHSSMTGEAAAMRIAALNAFISKHISVNPMAIPVGPNKFFFKDMWEQTKSKFLHIRSGYFTSIRPGQQSVLLNINVATSAFYNCMNVAEFFRSFRDVKEAQSMLKGMNVYIGYHRLNHGQDYDLDHPDNRHRVVAGFGEIPSQQRFDRDGTPTTVESYFAGINQPLNPRNRYYPCISVNIAPPKANEVELQSSGNGGGKGKGRSNNQKQPRVQWIPPEKLWVDPYQPYGKLLSPKMTEEMIRIAVQAPSVSQDRIVNDGFALLGIGPNHIDLGSAGMQVADKLLMVPARSLEPPRIVYRDGVDADVNLASWNLTKRRFYWPPYETYENERSDDDNSPVYPLTSEVCTVDLRGPGADDRLDDLGHQISEEMPGLGMRFESGARPHAFKISPEACGNDSEFQKQLEVQLRQEDNPSLVVFVLPEKSSQLYAMVKRVCDQMLGLHSICFVNHDKVKFHTKKQRGVWVDRITSQTAANLAMKLNMKLGGQNHQICAPNTTGTTSVFAPLSQDTIVFGADVSHAGGAMRATPSVAAVVANDDEDFASFPASMRLQASKQEIIEDLEDMVYHRLLRFAKTRGFFPRRILFFRDGVGENQFKDCRNLEIPRIRRAFMKAAETHGSHRQDTAAQLDLIFIVVGKRHHTRFYATSESQTYPDDRNGLLKRPSENGDQADVKLNGNLLPGLLVENVVTRSAVDSVTDFFLQSHAALKGTARSAHYSILERGSMDLEDIKYYTHAFCYNYMRATKGVSYVGPAYYADRLCDRDTRYLQAYINHPSKQFGHEMTQAEKEDDQAGRDRHAKRVAALVMDDELWRPDQHRLPDREPNPWHPEFDDRMFWL